MAFDDLDLEFEDEEEAKKKKNEAVQVDVDLEFAVPEGDMTKSRPAMARPSAPAPQAASPPGATAAKPVARPAATVTKIDEARKEAKPAAARPAAVAVKPVASAPKVSGTSALQEDHLEMEGAQIVEMREQMRRVEFEAQVKVAVAEFKTELLSELLSDTKLMQHQIEQLLIRINAKHPDMKQEVLMIKKILADFTAKKRK